MLTLLIFNKKFLSKKSIMSIVISNIIEKYYSYSRNNFHNGQFHSLSHIAGNILIELYDMDEKKELDEISKTFLNANQSIKHIINILNREKTSNRIHAINEEYRLLLEENITKYQNNQNDTLNSIITDVTNKLNLEHLSEMDFENQLIEQVSNKMIESRVEGKLDNDSRIFVSHPDHKQKIRTIHRSHKSGGNKKHIIHEELSKVVNSNIQQNSNDINQHIKVIETGIKDILSLQVERVNKGIDVMGQVIYNKLEEISKNQVTNNTFIEKQTIFVDSLVTVINELTQIVSVNIMNKLSEVLNTIDLSNNTQSDILVNFFIKLEEQTLTLLRDNILIPQINIILEKMENKLSNTEKIIKHNTNSILRSVEEKSNLLKDEIVNFNAIIGDQI